MGAIYNTSMRIIARSTLRSFWEAHPDAEQPLKAWYDEASRAKWSSPTDMGGSALLEVTAVGMYCPPKQCLSHLIYK